MNDWLNKSPVAVGSISLTARVALCATDDWVFACVSAADSWLLAGEEEMRSPPVMKLPGLAAGPLHIHNWSRAVRLGQSKGGKHTDLFTVL